MPFILFCFCVAGAGSFLSVPFSLIRDGSFSDISYFIGRVLPCSCSVAFHATLKFWGQAADELTMLWISHLTVVALMEASHTINKNQQDNSSSSSTSVRIKQWLIGLLSVVTTLIYLSGTKESFSVFFLVYASGVLTIGYLGFQLTRSSTPLRAYRFLFACAIVTYIGGFVLLWLPTEVLFCKQTQFLHGHAWFHLSSMVGSSGLLFVALLCFCSGSAYFVRRPISSCPFILLSYCCSHDDVCCDCPFFSAPFDHRPRHYVLPRFLLTLFF
jgi:hypothetical protein